MQVQLCATPLDFREVRWSVLPMAVPAHVRLARSTTRAEVALLLSATAEGDFDGARDAAAELVIDVVFAVLRGW